MMILKLGFIEKKNLEDAQWLAQNAEFILQFMNDGYANSKSTIEHKFSGFQGRKDVKRKCVEAKVAYDKNGNVLAMSLYNAYLSGKKCVGLTITTDSSLIAVAKEALKQIIRFDINHHNMFYWCECSGAIEHYFNKFNGFKIPNFYVHALYESQNMLSRLTELSDDGYHYTRRLTVGDTVYDVEKIIYGFPSEELFNQMLQDNKQEIDKWLENLENEVNEAYDHLSDIDKAFMVVDMFGEYINDGVKDFTPYAMGVLKKYTQFLKNTIKSDAYYSRYTRDEIVEEYECALEYIANSSELKLFKC